MKLSWAFVILLLVFVALFSVQNAEVMTVHFFTWQIQMSAALVIQLAALLGGLVGLAFGAWSRRAPPRSTREPAEAATSTVASTPSLRSSAPVPTAKPVTPLTIAPPAERKPEAH
jgi:uncharacterized integral membrane protein